TTKSQRSQSPQREERNEGWQMRQSEESVQETQEAAILAAPSADGDLDTEATQEDPLGALSYRQLVWRRFRRSKLGLLGGGVLVLFYLTAIFAEFFAPYHYSTDNIRLRYVPPQRVRLGPHGP